MPTALQMSRHHCQRVMEGATAIMAVVGTEKIWVAHFPQDR